MAVSLISCSYHGTTDAHFAIKFYMAVITYTGVESSERANIFRNAVGDLCIKLTILCCRLLLR